MFLLFSRLLQFVCSDLQTAPSAPVINPQTPNSATQTSLRVFWSLFSDDTVEFYELYYRPVLEDSPVDGSTPGTVRSTFRTTKQQLKQELNRS